MKKRFKYIGENIRKARMNKGLTIEQLAEQADISESFLGLVERGVSGLSIETLIDIAKVLDVSTDSILLDTSVIPQEAPTDLVTLMTLIQNFTEEDINFLLDFVKLYKKRLKP